MNAWASAEPAAALAWLATADSSQYVLSEDFFEQLAEFDQDKLLGMVDALPEPIQNNAIIAVTRSLANSDPAAAAELFAATTANRDIPWTAQLFRDLGRSWGRQDPERALVWAEAQSSNAEFALFGVLTGIVDSDVGMAIGMLDRLTPDIQAGLLTEIARQQAATDMPGALVLIEQFRGRPGYSDARTAVISELAYHDPAAAARMLQDTEPDSIALSVSNPFSLITVVVDNWMREDRQSLLDWAARIEQPELQNTAVHCIAERWALSDAEGARQWLPTLSSGTARDSALNAFISARAGVGVFESDLLGSFSSRDAAEASASNALIALASRNPEEAERLANSYLTNEDTRQNTLQRIGRPW
jgi:hypothetical protein